MNTKLLILIVCILLTTLASLIVGSLAKIPDEHFKHRRRRKHHKHHKHHINTSINTPQNISTASVSTPKIIQSTNSTSLPSNVSIRSNVVPPRYSPIFQNTSTKVYAPVTQLIPIPQIMQPQIIQPTKSTSSPSNTSIPIPQNTSQAIYTPAPAPVVPGIYKYTYPGRDQLQYTGVNIGGLTGTVDQSKLECDKTPNCVGFSRYIRSEDDIVPDTADGEVILLKAPFSITNENYGSVPGTFVPDMTYKTWSKIPAV
jgi:hypothetical protein